MSCMRCDYCRALRWYGLPMRPFTVTEFPGYVVMHLHICEACSDDRRVGLRPGEHPPRIHPPHLSMQ